MFHNLILLIITLNKSRNENPINSPKDPPTPATIEEKSNSKISSIKDMSVVPMRIQTLVSSYSVSEAKTK